MIHLVFETANVAILQSAIEMDESLAGKVIEIKDDYAVGPIADIYETEGYQARRDWWKNILEHSPYEESARNWRKELSIPEDAKVFLFAGKLEPKKDPELLISAFLRLHRQYPKTHLIIVGKYRMLSLIAHISRTTFL